MKIKTFEWMKHFTGIASLVIMFAGFGAVPSFAALRNETQRPSAPAGEGVSPIAIGVVPDIQYPLKGNDVCFLRLNLLAGQNNNVGVIDISTLVGIADGDVSGLQIAGFGNLVNNNAAALQLAGFFNVVDGDCSGIQIAGAVNYQNPASLFCGWQLAGFCNNAGRMYGLQLGLFNQAAEMNGVQIGLINVAGTLKGVQLGLGNVDQSSGVPFIPILNIGF